MGGTPIDASHPAQIGQLRVPDPDYASGVRYRRIVCATAVTTTALLAAACGSAASTAPAITDVQQTTTTIAATTTTTSCPLSSTPGASATVPVSSVCSAVGSPHFATPDDAMAYLAAAWNSGNVQKIDYVTDPAGRQQMDSMAAQMVNLRFGHCSQNPAGDYTCYFTHDIAASASSTTYPNPMNYAPGEAVFTVAPAAAPGWYLTEVIHCG